MGHSRNIELSDVAKIREHDGVGDDKDLCS